MKTQRHLQAHNGGTHTIAKRARPASQSAGRPKPTNRSRSSGAFAAVSERPIQTLAIIVGIGALLGFLAGRRGRRKAS